MRPISLQSAECRTPFLRLSEKTAHFVLEGSLLILVSSICIAGSPSGSEAQAPPVCTTTVDCAQKAVEAAGTAEGAVTALSSQVSDLRAQLANMKKVVDSIGKGNCTTLPLVSKFPLTVTPSCGDGSYVKAITFTHPGDQNFTFQESVAVTCCPLH